MKQIMIINALYEDDSEYLGILENDIHVTCRELYLLDLFNGFLAEHELLTLLNLEGIKTNNYAISLLILLQREEKQFVLDQHMVE